MAAADAPHRVDTRARGHGPSRIRADAELVKAAQRQCGDRRPDPQCAIQFAVRDALEQVARDRLIRSRGLCNGSGRDVDVHELVCKYTEITASALTPISRTSGGRAGLAVYDALREAIVMTELEPGQQVSENAIADKLGVSRTPVREALARLRDDQLVQIVPQLGTFVSRISVAGVDDAQFLREALECAAVRLVAEHADADDIEDLRELIVQQEHARDDGDPSAFFVLDDAFHSSICELSGRPIAWTIVARANGHLNRVRRLSLAEPRYIAEMIIEHKVVLAAIEKGNPDEAETALRHHLRMVLSDLPTIRHNHPEYFEDD
jgi:GntR family transcriptional regulator, rspAB operon transcriptional repressor